MRAKGVTNLGSVRTSVTGFRALAFGLGLAVLAAAVAFGACEGEQDITPGSPSPPGLPSPSGEFPSLGLRFDVPSEVRTGDDVPFRLTVVNVSAEPLTLGLGGLEEAGYPASFQFFIQTAAGEEVTCWLCANRVADASLSFRTLQPGEELDLGWDWDQTDNDLQPVPAGMYVVYGTFSASVGSEEENVAGSEEDIELTTEPRQFEIKP